MAVSERPSGRRIWLWVFVAGCITVLLCVGGMWIKAQATSSPYQRVGPGYMGQLKPGGPVVSYTPGGGPVEAVQWRLGEQRSLQVTVVDLQLIEEVTGETSNAKIRVIEDGNARWLAAARGTNPLVESPTGKLYLHYANDEAYVIDPCEVTETQLTASVYQGKSRVQLNSEQGFPVPWVHCPMWGPTGDSVVFATKRSGQWELWVVDVATRTEQVLAACGDKPGYPEGLTDTGHIVMRCPQEGGKADIWLVDPASGAKTLALQGYEAFVRGAFVLAWSGPETSSQLALYDLSARSSVILPAAPQGYAYRMPFDMSPDEARIALWLATNEGDRVAAILDVTENPARLKTYPPPAGSRTTGGLYWLDNATVAVQVGSVNDPAAATYSLRVY